MIRPYFLIQIMKTILIAFLLLPASVSLAQDANYDESKIPPYVLPDLLTSENGEKVKSQSDWIKNRRPEILQLFERNIYGKSPEHPKDLHFKVLNEDKSALNGIATRKEVAIYFTKNTDHYVTMLIYIPNKRNGAVPLFYGLNFKGNHAINSDAGITIPEELLKSDDKLAERGAASSRWPVEMLMEKGYGLATIQNSNIEPDKDTGFQEGLHPLFYKKGQNKPEADEWGTIAAWSFGLSCGMDYFETDKDVDAKKVIVMGHSRNGKAALWAGASDQRFALVISNDSGCGGAALSRRRIGETGQVINSTFPHWFCENFKQYNNNEDKLPVDQHQLIALMAPRPVYIASAQEDYWADPKGEFLSGVYASPVYQLFGLQGLTVDQFPPVNQPVMEGSIGYHIRTGKHDINLYDWEQYVKFANKHLE